VKKVAKIAGGVVNRAFSTNLSYFEKIYSMTGKNKFPDSRFVRFYNIYLKKMLSKKSVALDFGFGNGNQSIFLIENGYEVYGIEVAKNACSLLKVNFKKNRINNYPLKRFSVISPGSAELLFKDEFFDLIVANQSLYYLPSRGHIKKVCKEFSRCLRPGGIVYFTMVGNKNSLINNYSNEIHGDMREILCDDPSHRLYGLHQFILVVKDKKDLKNLFSEFECIATGYFDDKLCDDRNFHWVFVGRKTKKPII